MNGGHELTRTVDADLVEIVEFESAREVKCRPIAPAVALRENWIEEIAELSPGSTLTKEDLFAGNTLAFQFAYWGHAFWGAAGCNNVGDGQRVSLFSASEAGVVGLDGAIMLDDVAFLDLYSQFIQTHQPYSLFERTDGELHLKSGVRRRVAGTYFMGFTPAFQNYAHWLTDTLPFLPYYATVLKPQGVKLIVADPPKYYQEALKLYEIGDQDIFSMPRQVVEFEQLLFCSLVSLWSPPTIVHSTALDIIRRVGGLPRESDRRTRLYLSREDATQRQLLNEDLLLARLRDEFGFKVVRCAELSFADQVRAMGNVAILVGIHGAAMGNTMFCPPGCIVLELFPEYCLQPHFRSMAARAGLKYGFLQGTSFEWENSREVNNAWGLDFVIDIDIILRTIRSLIGRS